MSIDNLPLSARLRKGIHFFFYDETIDERLKRIIVHLTIIIGIASFVLFFYLTFIHGWGSFGDAVNISTGVP